MQNKYQSTFLTSLVGIYIVLVFILDDSLTLYIVPNIFFLALCVFCILKKDFLVHKDKLVAALVLFFIWIGLSLLWAHDKGAVQDDIKKQIIFLILFFVITKLLKGDNTNIYILLKWFVIAGLILFLVLISMYGFSGIVSAILGGVRIGGELIQVNKLGSNCAIIAIISFNLFLEKKKKLYIIPIALMLFLMLATESRRSFLVLVIGILTSLYLCIKAESNGSKKIKTIILAGMLLSFSFYIASSSSLFTNLFERFFALGKDSGDSLRILYLKYGLQSFLSHPILGLGSGNSHLVTLFAAGKKTYLHNNYIEMLVNLGIIGFIIFYSIYACLLRDLKVYTKSVFEARVLFVLLIAQLVADLGVTSYSYKMTYIIFAISYATVIACRTKNIYSDNIGED